MIGQTHTTPSRDHEPSAADGPARRLLLVAVAAVLAVALVACGGGSSDDDEATNGNDRRDEATSDESGAAEDDDADEGDGPASTEADEADAGPTDGDDPVDATEGGEGPGSDDGGTDGGTGGGTGGGLGDLGTASGGAVCDAVPASVVQGAFPGAAFEEPSPLRSQRGVGDVTWEGIGCRWESPTVSVRAAAAGPGGFADGFVCVEPTGGLGNEVEPVTGLGDQAWWSWDDFGDGSGSLAVCAGQLRVDVDVDGEGGTALDRAAALTGARSIADAML